MTYQGLERAGAVLLAGFEPQDESPIVFLRLRKAARSGRLAVYSIAALAGPGLALMSGTLLPTVPGEEAEALDRLAGGGGLDEAGAAAAQALRQPGAVILAGERLAEVPGALSAAARLAQATGAGSPGCRAGRASAARSRPAPCPRLLPGGRPVADQAARAEVARAWGVASLPAEPGRDTAQHPRRRGGAARSAPWSSPASTPPTCPTRRRRSTPSRPRRSWSAWSCGSAR